MGIGIGIVFTVIVMFTFGTTGKISAADIEKAARGMGMHYDDECKSIFDHRSTDGE